MKRLIWLAVIVLILAGAALFWFLRTKNKPLPRNVILITVDTLRADHVGSYGYARAQTPHMDRWSRQGAQFMNATATTPLTLPAHCSIMTGAYPLDHGVRDNGGFYLNKSWQTLAETLQQAGWTTGGFISAFVLDRRWGIAQGFQHYFDNFELSRYKMISLDSVQRTGDETLREATAWLDQKKNQKFFAWIHFYDPHTPYDPPEPFRSAFANQRYGLYDGEISFTDNLLGRLYEYLEKNGLLSTTIIVLTSDHGEGLGEHQETGHGVFIYDATTHVPLVVLAPGQEPRKIIEQVRSIDLYPTICQMLGVKPPASVRGTSLVPLLQGKSLPARLTAYSESYYAKFHYGWSELKSLRTADYKYIDAPHREFYRLSNGEQDNLYNQEQQRAGPFISEMQRLIAQASSKEQGPARIDDDSLEKLQALGYIGSYTHTAALTAGNEVLADPKDKIGLYNRIKVAQSYSADGKTKEAMENIERVIQEDPGIMEAYLVRGNLLLKDQKFEEARKSFQNALSRNPNFPSAIFGIANAYEREKNWDAARSGFQRLTEIDPNDSKAFFHLGDIALAQKQYSDALNHFKKVVELDPEQSIYRNRLGACYLEMKQYDPALSNFSKALELNPRTPNAHFNTALAYEETGKPDAAIPEYRKELELFPESYVAHFNISRIYRSEGKRPEEKQELENCIQKQPDFGLAYLYLAKNEMDSGDLQRAKTLAEEGLEKTKEKEQLPLGHYILADIYNRLGQPQNALLQIQQARELQQ
jgi:arylsulfatase A-like enzyme/Tfp pilus assembly protein PilF